MEDVLFDVMGTCVDIGLPIGTVCSEEPFSDWNELFGMQRAPSDGAVNVWPCFSLVELELVKVLKEDNTGLCRTLSGRSGFDELGEGRPPGVVA